MSLLEIFLKLAGIEGESAAKGHEKETVVVSYEQSVVGTRGGSGTGGSAGKAVLSDVRFRKHVDKGSVPLLLAAAMGTHIAEATFSFRRTWAAIPVDIYKVTLDNVRVLDVAQRAGTGPQYPLDFDTLANGPEAAGLLEEVMLDYDRIHWQYQLFDAHGAPAGSVSGGWDRKLNKKI